MCGFLGVIKKDIFSDDEKNHFQNNLNKYSELIVHRGPDEEGRYLKDNVFFLHRRLAIIDLKEGQQPFISQDDRYILVFNGEIYNYPELKEKLRSEGECFRTTSDTEVLFRLLIKKGKQALKEIDGMFAFVFFDKKNNQIIAGRDICGEKPIYYFIEDEKIFFASEIKSLLSLITTELNPESLVDFFIYNYVPAPQTVFSGIKKLLPAQVLTYSFASDLVIEEYWTLASTKINYSYQQASQDFDDLFAKSLRGRLLADVPVGAFLSGGVDSSFVVRETVRAGKKDLYTFSIGFNEARYDESEYSKLVSEKFQTIHHHFYFSLQDVLDNYNILQNFDQPFADASALPVYFLAHQTRRFLKVVLSGDGADELFGGYDRYYLFNYLKLINILPKPMKFLFLDLIKGRNVYWANGLRKLISASTTKNAYTEICSNFAEQELQDLFSGTRLEQEFVSKQTDIFNKIISSFSGNIQEKLMYCDLNYYLPDDILAKVDTMTMASSIESRTPFLNKELIEFAFSLPFSIRKKKMLIKNSLAEDLGKNFAFRRKKGFGLPLDEWFRADLAQILLNDLHSIDNLSKYLNLDYIKQLIRQHKDKKQNNHYKLWTVFAFVTWAKANLKYL